MARGPSATRSASGAAYLVESGDLDEKHLKAMPTLTVTDTITWNKDDGFGCVPKDAFN